MYRYYIVNRNGDGDLSYPNTISDTDLYLYGHNGVISVAVEKPSRCPPLRKCSLCMRVIKFI